MGKVSHMTFAPVIRKDHRVIMQSVHIVAGVAYRDEDDYRISDVMISYDGEHGWTMLGRTSFEFQCIADWLSIGEEARAVADTIAEDIWTRDHVCEAA